MRVIYTLTQQCTTISVTQHPHWYLVSLVLNILINMGIKYTTLWFYFAPFLIRRGGKNTQKNYTKKDLHNPNNHDGLTTHLKPDILECEVKWALGSITTNKASRGDGTPVELFQILKHCESAAFNMPANLENSAVATGLEKVSFHSNFKENQCQRVLKLSHNCAHLTC